MIYRKYKASRTGLLAHGQGFNCRRMRLRDESCVSWWANTLMFKQHSNEWFVCFFGSSFWYFTSRSPRYSWCTKPLLLSTKINSPVPWWFRYTIQKTLRLKNVIHSRKWQIKENSSMKFANIDYFLVWIRKKKLDSQSHFLRIWPEEQNIQGFKSQASPSSSWPVLRCLK